MPFFSVIIPTFNRAEFIAGAISSVLNQTFSDFELIIVDDASKDNTAEIVHSFNDVRIIYLRNTHNEERCASRNTGIHQANGQYICFLDSDDFYLENHLMALYKEIESKANPQALFLVNAYDMVDGVVTERDCPEIAKYNRFHFILTYTFNPPRMCIHKEILRTIQFDPAINICEDVDLSLRIAVKYPIFQLNERTVIYNLHPGTFTLGDPLKPFKQIDSFEKIFKKKELKGYLPRKSRHTQLSMAYYHASIYFETKKKYSKMYPAILYSFLLCPKGYNGKTNKILLAMTLYHIPVFGNILQWIKRITLHKPS